jgi:hypothetical protein
MMTAYLVLILLFAMPLAVDFFAQTFFAYAPASKLIHQMTYTSPFAASFSLPLVGVDPPRPPNWPVFIGFVSFYTFINVGMLVSMLWMFSTRWRASAGERR